MKKLTKISLALSGLVISTAAFAGPEEMKSSVRTGSEIEVSCRVKAKEIAAETYRTCVVEKKSSQIELIKKDYLAKIKALKSHYESELKKISGKNTAAVEAVAPEAASEKSESAEAKGENSEAPEAKSKIEKTDLSNTISVPAEKKEVSSDDAVVIETKPSEVVKPTPEVSSEMSLELKPAKSEKTKSSKSSKTSKSLNKKAPVSSTSARTGVHSKMIPMKPIAMAPKLSKKAKITEVSVQLKPAPVVPTADESSMDMPEPVPVENLSSKSAI